MRRGRADSERLLVYRNGSGYRELRVDEVNARFKELTDSECSVKDLRTWQGTVLAASAFGTAERLRSQRGRIRVRRAVFERVAEALGNTPTVARDSYIDPRVVEAFDRGATIAAALRRADRIHDEEQRTEVVERAVIRLLRAANRAGRG